MQTADSAVSRCMVLLHAISDWQRDQIEPRAMHYGASETDLLSLPDTSSPIDALATASMCH